MEVLSPLEQAVLDVIALHVPEIAAALADQQGKIRVAVRKNTGAGFYTTFDFAHPLIKGVASPVGDVRATVADLQHEMGFMLWLREGRIHQLEGYTNGDDSTVGIDFERVAFAITFPLDGDHKGANT
jgi:hypothetical protein